MIVGFCRVRATWPPRWRAAGPARSSGMLFTDSGSGRAAELAAELGGEAVGSNAELAERADLVVLAVKPATLEEVAAELAAARSGGLAARRDPAGAGRRGVSRTPTCCRVMPNVAVEVRRGVLCVAGDGVGRGPASCSELLGHVVELPDAEFDAATAVMGCAPAYLALAVEALADAGADGRARRGAGPRAGGRDDRRDRRAAAHAPPGRRAQGGRLARRQHRGRARGARPRGRAGGLRGGGAGLAGEDAAE